MGGKLSTDEIAETKEEEFTYYVERLHKVPTLIKDCCNLINMEWKRNFVDRMRSIENSSENFPMSLVLIRKNGKIKVVGHCKISKLCLSESKVFVESVVIHPKLRGKGLGKFLMKECEEVCKSKNIKWIFLATRGQEIFYEKLGYKKCPPISISSLHLNDESEDVPQIGKNNNESKMNSKQNMNQCTERNAPPPPPLPNLIGVSSNFYLPTTYMKKQIVC